MNSTLLKDIPYFVKFTFMGDNDVCYSITDKETLNYVLDNKTDEPITSLKIGQEISFSPATEKYVVKEIEVQKLVDDIRINQIGIDSLDCAEQGNDPKEWLFKIFVVIDKK